MKTEFTAEQNAALDAFVIASESHDLHAFGQGRKDRAWRDLAACYCTALRLGLAAALTANETAQGKEALTRI